jgi:hypothetical protein
MITSLVEGLSWPDGTFAAKRNPGTLQCRCSMIGYLKLTFVRMGLMFGLDPAENFRPKINNIRSWPYPARESG